MKAFFAKYSGVTHALAVFWALLIAAYAASVPFRTAVDTTAVTIYQSLPHGFAVVVSAAFGILAPLWAFYRNGQTATTATATIEPGQSGQIAAKATASNILPSVIVALLCGSLLITTTGCSGQATAAALIGTVGNAVAQLATLEGKTDLATKLTNDTAIAVNDVQNWKSGSPTDDVIEALNLVEDDLDVLPIPPQYQALVDLAISAVEGVLAALPPSVTGKVGALHHHRVVPLGNQPKTAKDFKKRWNAALVQSPSLTPLTLK